MTDPRIRQLTIKTGVVKRLAKERTVCDREVQTERNRLEKFRNEGKDDHVLRKQEEVLQECLMIIPDTTRRLQKEYIALEKFLEDEAELKETKEYEAAVKVLADAKDVIGTA